jgi:hypothetical protein
MHEKRWFRTLSWLSFHRHDRLVAVMRDERLGVAAFKGYRQASFGPALRLQFQGEDVSDGWDPATVKEFIEIPG